MSTACLGAVTDPWVRHVPAVFRALADPSSRGVVPRFINASLEDACAYWGGLHYALSSVLGWEDVGAGLAWWYAAGKPTDDSPVLTLVREIWGEDDLIDYYAAWAWCPAGTDDNLIQEQDPLNGNSPAWLSEHSRWPDEDWWRAFIRRGRLHHHSPFYGGDDPLHLAAHSGPPRDALSVHPLVHVLSAERRVVLVTEGLAHWLADLRRLETQLPPLGDRSWRVEVFDRTVGWLGEYRRSRVTGRWFTGKHAVHLRGSRTHE